MTDSRKVAVQAVQWIAAEYKFLQALFRDLLYIEGKHGDADASYYRKARRIFQYISRCETKADIYIPKVIHQAKNHPELISLATKIDVAEKQLVKAFSLYSGELRQEIDQLLKDHPAQAFWRRLRKTKPDPAVAVRTQQLVKEMEEHLKVLLTWTEGLQVCLRDYIDSFTDLTRRGFTKTVAVGTAGIAIGGAIGGFSREALATKRVNIVSRLSQKNKSRAQRPATRFIILHHTESNDSSGLASVYQKGTANYVVTTDGMIYQTIEHHRIAKHAGRSMYNGLTNISNYSIGIEIVGYYNQEMTAAQYSAVKELLKQLKVIYNVPDKNILPHTAVAYERPNKWNDSNYRPRRLCGMLMATPSVRKKLGIGSMARSDLDLDAKRLKPASDPLALALFYENVYPYYLGKKPSLEQKPKPREEPTKPTPEKKPRLPRLAEPDEDEKPFKEIGIDGDTAWSVAKREYAASTTIYFLPWGTIRTGKELIQGKESFNLGKKGEKKVNGKDMLESYLPPKTKVLVGYTYGGEVTAQRSAIEICGKTWNYPSTFYYLSDKTIIEGDEIDSAKIKKGTLVFFMR